MNFNQVKVALLNEEDIQFDQAEEGGAAHQLRITRISRNPLLTNKGKVHEDDTKKFAKLDDEFGMSNSDALNPEFLSFERVSLNSENSFSYDEELIQSLNAQHLNDKNERSALSFNMKNIKSAIKMSEMDSVEILRLIKNKYS